MKKYFGNFSPIQQLLLLVIIALLSWLSISIIGTLVAIFFWGTEAFTNTNLLLSNESFLRYFQIIQSIGLFILPPILFEIVTSGNLIPNNKHKTHLNATLIIIAISVTIAAQPFVSFLGVFNNTIELPEYLTNLENWMREKEIQAQAATEIFLSSSHWSLYILNIIIIAIIPAIGEELMFRGALQGIFKTMFKNSHISVLITAALFSAIHIQFFGFLPRFILGVIFGYLMVFGKNIYLPILAHFTNNFVAFLMYQSYLNNSEDSLSPLDAGMEYPQLILTISSIVGVTALIWILKRHIDTRSIVKTTR